MATVTGKARCIRCGKEKSTFRCEGCLQTFCYDHVEDHRQQLNRQFDEIDVSRDIFRQTLTELTRKSEKHPLIKQIDQWEYDSIKKIQQTAEEARKLLLKYTAEHFTNIENKLNKLTNQLRKSRQENDFFETDLQHWSKELERLQDILNNSSSITVKHSSIPLVNKIFVDVSRSVHMSGIDVNTRWTQDGITIAGGNGKGDGIYQLYCPFGLYVDDDETIYITDKLNHRVVEWKNGTTSGQIVAGGNGQGSQNDRVDNPVDVIVDKENDSLLICDYNNRRVVRWPRRNSASIDIIISGSTYYGLTMDNNGYIYVSDHSNNEVIRWKIGDTTGTVVAGGNGRGNRLDQLNSPTYVVVDQNYSVYVSDYNNHRVMKWLKDAKEGIVVAGGQGNGTHLTQLSFPGGIAVDQSSTVYVTDCNNHRVMRWLKGATQGVVIVGGNGKEKGANQFCDPWGLSFDRQGNLYVVDCNNHRVQKFNVDRSLST